MKIVRFSLLFICIYISNIYLTEKYVTKDSLRLIVGLDYIIGIYIGLMLDDVYASLINHW